MSVLAVLDYPDDEPVDEIKGGIDYGLDEGSPLDSLVGSASDVVFCLPKYINNK
jgi:hypothetical protein